MILLPASTWRRALAGILLAAGGFAAEPPPPPLVEVRDGVVQPRRPMIEAIDDAIRFLRKGDGGYVPGNIGGELAGYFMSATVNADGSQRQKRQLSFPARHHGYFIRTFLHYHVYTGQQEWLQRARDLADWNIAHSTPATDAYANLPYSAFQHNRPTGSADRNSIETDKPAFIGQYYLALYESTGERRYLDAARKIAATLAPRQREDGSWPFRVIPADGTVYQEFGGAPVFFVEFFARLHRHEPRPEYARARDRALQLLLDRNVKQGLWGTYHEDIRPGPGTHVSAEVMSFTADFLFRAAAERPELLESGRKVLAQMEGRLVHTEGHAASPAPAVAEQAGFAHIMAGHTARYCLALAHLYRLTRDPEVKRRAMSGLNAVTHMQSDAGLFRTHFYDTRNKTVKDPSTAPNWFSQHLYTVCHMLETMPVFPEIAPAGENHVLGFSTSPRGVRYAPDAVRYATILPAEVTLKLGFAPKAVQLGGRALREGRSGDGWTYDPATQVLRIRHAAGEVSVTR